LEFSGEIWYWRGPSPFHFIPVKAGVREAEGLELGDAVTVRLAVGA
jgi:hypothetical protein